MCNSMDRIASRKSSLTYESLNIMGECDRARWWWYEVIIPAAVFLLVILLLAWSAICAFAHDATWIGRKHIANKQGHLCCGPGDCGHLIDGTVELKPDG